MKKNLLLIPFYFFLINSNISQSNIVSGKNYALFFCVSEYQDPIWDDLPETKDEVQKIALELQDNYGFHVKIISNPKGSQIIEWIKTYNNYEYAQDDQVLLFFSMHGHFNERQNQGFLIPSDGKFNDPYGESWINYNDLDKFISLNKSEHILLALDACYSGAFGIRTKGRPEVAPWRSSMNCQEKTDVALRYNSRLYFSSGGKEYRTPARSLFASAWLELLRNGLEIGVIRSNDIRYYLNQIEFPSPESGSFTNHQEGGDFVFVHKKACSINTNNQYDSIHHPTGTSNKLLSILKQNEQEKTLNQLENSYLIKHFEGLEKYIFEILNNEESSLNEIAAAYFYRSKVAYDKKDFDSSLINLKKIRALSYNKYTDEADSLLHILKNRKINELKKLYTDSKDPNAFITFATSILNNQESTFNEIAAAHFYLGKFEYNRKNFNAAIKHFIDLNEIEYNQFTDEARYLHTYIFYLRRNFEQVEKMVTESIDNNKKYSSWSAKQILLLAEIYYAKSNYINSRALYISILDNIKDDKEIIALAKKGLHNMEQKIKKLNQH